MKTIQILKVLLGLSSICIAFSEPDIIIKDEFNIYETRVGDPELYWEWEPEPRLLSCVDWGGNIFYGYIGLGEYILGSSLSIDDAIDVVRRFQEEGKTRFLGLSDWDLYKIMKYIDSFNPQVVQPYRNVMDDTYISSGLKDWIDKNNAGVCFFSPIKHGLLTGKYIEPVKFGDGDFRSRVSGFDDDAIIKKMQKNKLLLEEKFYDHPHPLMKGIIN